MRKMMHRLYRNRFSFCLKCTTFMLLIWWDITKHQNLALAQEEYRNKLHFPQLRKPTPINHFHPKHKPVYQEIFRPSNRIPEILEHHEFESEKPILHGRLEYPKTNRPPAYVDIVRKIDLSNDNNDVTTISGIIDSTVDYHNEEALLRTVQSPAYTYVPSTERNIGTREEMTTSYVINMPIVNSKEAEAINRLRSEHLNYNGNREDKTIDVRQHHRNNNSRSENRYTSLHQKMPNHADVLVGHFRPKHPKRYHEIRRGSIDNLPANSNERLSFAIVPTRDPITTNRPDTNFYSTGGRNTTIISIQELANRFTTTSPSLYETDNNLRYKMLQQRLALLDKNYYTTKSHGLEDTETNTNRNIKGSFANIHQLETQVRNPHVGTQDELLRSQQTQRAYGGLQQRPRYESVSPSISPPQYYEIDYDDRMSPRPRQYKYKWNQPSTEAIRSINTYNNLYHQAPPKRYYQIQRTRQNNPNSPIPYPPIPTYPSTVETKLTATAERRNEYVKVDPSETSADITSTRETFSPEPTALPKSKSSKGPCKLAFMKDTSNKSKSNGVQVNVNGKTFRYKERSVVVVCKNMNASDVQKLVPSLALSGCFNQTTANGTNTGINNSGKCVQLKGNFFQKKSYQKESSSNDNGCIGEKELCNKITKVASETDSTTKKSGWVPNSKKNSKNKNNKDRDCSKDDVTCTLLEKVRWYLKQHYKDSSKHKSGSTALSTNRKNIKNRASTTPRPRNIQKTILVLLPCRERGSKTTKQWLMRLQTYLRASSSSNKTKIKIVTILSCKARQFLSSLETNEDTFAGIVSFEPRSLGGRSKLSHLKDDSQIGPDGQKVFHDVEYCDTRALNMMQLARLGKRLSRSGRLSVVYTYSPAAASAMKLLSTLILGGKVDVVGAAPTSGIDTAYEDAQKSANSEQSDAILYIGGPPNPNNACRNNQQFGHIIQEIATNNTELSLTREESGIQEADCDCRQWAFQFLRPKSKLTPPSESEFSHTTTEDTTILPVSDTGEGEILTTDNRALPLITTGNHLSPVEFSEEEVASVTTTTEDYALGNNEFYDVEQQPLQNEIGSDGFQNESPRDNDGTNRYNTYDYDNTEDNADEGDTTTSYPWDITNEVSTFAQPLTSRESTTRYEDPTTSKFKRKRKYGKNGRNRKRFVMPKHKIYQVGNTEQKASVEQMPVHPVRGRNCIKTEEDKLWLVIAIVVSSFGLMTVTIGTAVLMVSLKKSSKLILKHEYLLPLGLLLLFISIATMAVKPTYELCALKRILPGLGYTCTFVGMLLQLFHELDKNVYIVNPKTKKLDCIFFGVSFRQVLSSKENSQVLIGLCLTSIQVIIIIAWLSVQPPRLLTHQCQCQAIISIQTFAIFSFVYPFVLGLLVSGFSMLSLVWKTNSGAKWNLFAVLCCGISWICLVANVEYLNNFKYLNLLTHVTSSLVLLLFVFTRKIVNRIRSLLQQTFSEDERGLQMTANSSLPEYPPARSLTPEFMHPNDRDRIVIKPTNGSLSMRSNPATDINIDTLKKHSMMHSYVNRSYSNTYSSCGSFRLPSVIAMPESSAWQQICRWQMAEADRGTGEEEFDDNLITTTSTSSSPISSSGNNNGSKIGSVSSNGVKVIVKKSTMSERQIFEEEELEAQIVISASHSDKDENEDDIDPDRISHKTTASSNITQLDRDNKIITLSSLTTTDNGVSRS